MQLRILGLQGVSDVNVVTSAVKRLTIEQTKAALAITNLNEEQIASILVNKGVAEAEAKATAATIAQSMANTTAATTTTTLSASFGSLKTVLNGLKAAFISNPITAIIAIATTVIPLIYNIVSATKKGAEELRQEYESTVSELSSIESELQNVRDRINELNSLDKLSTTEQSELENLQKQNEYLTYQYEVKKKIADLQKQEVAKETKEELYDKIPSFKEFLSKIFNEGTENLTFNDIIVDTKSKYYDLQDVTDRRNQTIKAQSSYEAGTSDFNSYSDTIKYQTEIIEKYETEIAENLEEIESLYASFFDNEGNIISGYEEEVAEIEKVFDLVLGTDWKKTEVIQKINDILGSEQFSDIEDKISSAVSKKDILNIISESDELLNSLLSSGISMVDIFEYVNNTFDDVSENVNNVTDSVSDLSTTLSSLESISSGLDILGKIYTDVENGESFDWSNIIGNEDFEESFSNLDAYENFIKTIADSPDDIKACQQAFNTLVTEYINASGVLDNLNDSNKNIVISMLEEMGISNASTIVTQKLAEAKAKLYLQNLLSKQSIDVVISNLGTEATACNMTKAAFANLVAQEVIFNNNNLDISSKISQLQALAKAAGATSSILANVMNEKEFSNSRYWTNKGYTYDEYLAEMWGRTYNNLNFDVDIPEYNFVGNSSSSGGSSNSSGSNNSEPKTFDWIEIAINRIESAVDKLKTAASNTYKTITSRLSATSNAFKKITSEIDIQQKAYNRYMKEANAVGLSSSLAQKVRDGAIDIQEYDEKTQELISDYQDWYEKALDASDAVDELKNSLSELYEEKFDLINANFENQLSDLEHQANTYENKLSILEAQGFSASVNYYSALERISKSQISSLEKQYDELQKTLSEAVSSGKIEKYSEAWYDMQNDIVAVDEAIQDATLSMYEYQKSIQELNWENFDRMQDKISAITDEADFLSELLENSDMFNDKGKITSNGIAQMGLYASSYSVYMSQAKKYADEVRKIEDELADSPGNTDLIDRKNELLDLQRESISAALEEKQAIADLVSEGIEKELSALQELIDEYSNALESAKDLHDYQKKVAEYSDSISSIEKQLMAYSGDDSEEARKKIQELKVDLNETQEDLKDAEYDRYISEQKSLLDSIYTEYETLLNSRLDDIDNLLSEAISISDKHTDEIKGTINNAASSVGYSISETMQHIWEEGTSSGSIDSAIDSTINSISTKLGDVDLDGKITAADSRLALKFSAGIIDLTDEQLIAADANQDGIITAADARLILQAAAQLLDLDKIQGFSSGGMVDRLKSVVKSNNDDYITINTLKKGEAVLTPEQTLDFKKFVDELPRLTYLTDTSTLLSHIRGNTNINRSTEIGKIDINIPIEHVSDYNDFVNQLRKDNKFENLIRSMSVDLLSGKSTLSKNKYKW